jgi:hypothetical protein
MDDELDEAWEDDEPPEPPPFRCYSNTIRTLPNAYDLTIDFGHQSGDEPIEWLTRVSMTWEEAKVLTSFVGAALRQYEGTLGRVRDIEGLEVHPGNGGHSRRGEDDDETEEPEDQS